MVEMTDKGTAGVWAGENRGFVHWLGQIAQAFAGTLHALHRAQWDRPWGG